jgi:ribosomal protein S18 acetylase RimI-like enzyme
MVHNDIEYRKANCSDARKLAILYKQVYIQTYGTEGVSDEFADFITPLFSPERIVNTITDDPDQIIVAEYKGNLVGVAEIGNNKLAPIGALVAPELNKLYILEWFCGRGIGYRLLREVEEVIVQRGHTHMWLWVLASNQRAVEFYERNEFEGIGFASFQMAKNVYENLVMVKQLRDDSQPGHNF